MGTSTLKAITKYVVGDDANWAVYKWSFANNDSGAQDPAIEEMDVRSPLCAEVKRQLARTGSRLAVWRTLHLWRSARIRLFVLRIEQQVAAIGLVQDASLHRRVLRHFGEPGEMLGPYWTDPLYRGRGLYGRLLRHTINVSRDRSSQLYIYASVNNTPSRKGIERVGFEPLGCFHLRRRFCRHSIHITPCENAPARVTKPD